RRLLPSLPAWKLALASAPLLGVLYASLAWLLGTQRDALLQPLLQPGSPVCTTRSGTTSHGHQAIRGSRRPFPGAHLGLEPAADAAPVPGDLGRRPLPGRGRAPFLGIAGQPPGQHRPGAAGLGCGPGAGPLAGRGAPAPRTQ